MIKDFTPRLYQEMILGTCAQKNTLVVLPTGLGKTNIFLMLAAQRLEQHPGSKILMIGPTRPLIDQYLLVFKKHFEIDESKMAVFTGFVPPEKRAELWKTSQIIFSTPQGLENDIISGRINLEEVSLLGVDEAHRAVGDYAYVWVAKEYQKRARFPKIIAMTASPGSDLEKISEVCRNLFIEDIEVRTESDPDVSPYVQEIDISWLEIELPAEFIEIKKLLEDCYKARISELKNYLPELRAQMMGKKDILKLQAELHSQISRGEKSFESLKSVSLLAEAMKIQHALELIETQGIAVLHNYFEKLQMDAQKTKVKAVKNLVADPRFKTAWIKTERLYEAGTEHPKLDRLKQIIEEEVSKDPETKIMIFNQYRDSALAIQRKLSEIKGVVAKVFVGQQKKGETGLSQKKQKEMMDQFRSSEFNVLIATSVGEEGLDIPSVDSVVFYEPIPSAIRHIQRRGRTGRQEKGKVLVLVAKNTRDEGYRWAAHHKEKRMYRNIEDLKKKILTKMKTEKNEQLKEYIAKEPELKIFADVREKASGVIKELAERGVNLGLQQLETGDYLCSSRVAVEFKTVEDFVNSIIDGRLLSQAKALKRNFERPVIIIEGVQDIYGVRLVHPNAIRGMLATLSISYGIPILQTKNPKETAELLIAIAKREQEEDIAEFSMHPEKRVMTLKEQQEFIIGSLPGVGSGLARPLLRQFKTIKNIINATEKELQEVEKIGPQKAKDIKEVAEKEYQDF